MKTISPKSASQSNLTPKAFVARLASALTQLNKPRTADPPHAPVLRAAFPTLLRWDWAFPNPFKWRVYNSLDGGATYFFISDWWMYGAARQFAPDGAGLQFIVGVDEAGNEITGRSNAVDPDTALYPAPVLTGRFSDSELLWEWNYQNPVRWNVWTSIRGGAFFLSGDYWAAGTARQFAPDGGSETYFIVGVNGSGVEVTERSNPVCPDGVVVTTFPDFRISANGYNMAGNVLLLHFADNFFDSSDYAAADLIPYSGGAWAGPAGDADDITFSSHAGLRTVNFNWAGGTSETLLAGDATVSFWLKAAYSATATTDGYGEPLVCFNNNDNESGLILMPGIPYMAIPPRAASTLELDLSHGSLNGILNFTISKNQWVHLVFVVSGTYYQAYVNGELVDDATSTVLLSEDHMRLGGWWDEGQISIGPSVQLAEFAVFSRAMDDTEVAFIYNKQKG